MTLEDRLRGGLLGLLVGDALGVPYEFHAPKDIPARERIEMEPPPGFHRAHDGIAPGTYSDDGAQALCLLASLLHRDGLDVEDFGRRLVNWCEHGYLAVDDHVFDIGMQTTRALRAMMAGAPALEAGPSTERDNGNGSLMRVLPLALFHRGSDAELVRDAILQSRVTHGHARSLVCCAVYVLWARRIVEGSSDPFADAVAAARLCFDDEQLGELDAHVLADAPARGTGYVVDTLRSTREVMREPTYEGVVRAAIALGHDTDTTAAVAGGLAGLRDGIGGIPTRWLESLRGRELVDPLLEQLLRR